MSSYESWRLTNINQAATRRDELTEYDNVRTKYPQSTFSYTSTDAITDARGYAQVPHTTSRPSYYLSQESPVQPPPSKQERLISALAIVWPILVLLLYVAIVFHYLLRGEVNGIVAEHRIDAKVAFYAWLILSIFILEWLKASLAWFEAAVILNYPSWAPATEAQLVWHLDRGWAFFGNWCRVLPSIYRRLLNGETATLQAPTPLWWYLAGTFILFSITIPLSGLSIDQRLGLQLSYRPITILGVNETTFDVRTNAAVSNFASNNWRSGQVTTPSSPAIFYAPESTKNASGAFFEDFAQNIYRQDLAGVNIPAENRTVKVFSGPPVAERTYGRAWGFLTGVSCSAANLKTGMKMINATGPNNWTTIWGDSDFFDPSFAGLSPVFASSDSSFGIDASFVVVSDRDISAVGNGDYVNSTASNFTTQPIQGSLELAIWQSIPEGFTPDEGFKNMTLNSVVTSLNDSSVLGYGVRCTVESDVGYATLDVAARTYSAFVKRAADSGTNDLTTIGSNIPIFQYPGIFAIQSIVFEVLSTLSLGFLGPPSCAAGSDTTCSAFYGANLATGGVPRISQVGDSQFAKALQIPKTASAMMAIGPGNWTNSDLKGLDPTNDLISGIVPWQLVLGLLSLWTVLSTLLQILTFNRARWSQTLEAYAIKRFGANWRDAL
ncbi:hypothetical protein F5Y08DRAFT_348906 [Xylaria arbuscula]|nr:hypothetical protein F5Y08DRAFT_348906 [Xylaria arbuscula]